MNILVTGSAGMIGGYVVKGLIEKGHSVLGVDRVLPRTEQRTKSGEQREGFVEDEYLRAFKSILDDSIKREYKNIFK